MVVTLRKILLIDPNFPRPKKSPNHKNLLPVGLLKIGAYYKKQGVEVHLQRLSESTEPLGDVFDKVMVTSLFTYYSKYVIDAVKYARTHYPSAFVEVGGVWASLMPKECRELTGADNVYVGVMDEVEDMIPDYSLLDLDVDYQVLHTTRGCQRKCKACGVYCIEPVQKYRKTVKDLIFKKKLVFYDNNLLNNPYIDNILRELVLLKRQHKIKTCESQSGFDGRILRKKPHLAQAIKDSGFVYPKIAWDYSYKGWRKREEEINILKDVGYRHQDISVFFLINHDIGFDEMERKRLKCWEWGVQVNPCRYRPLDALYDNYNGRRKNQTSDDYYIHPNWSDDEIKQFNRNVRRHNLCLRFRTQYYSYTVEHKRMSLEDHKRLKFMSYEDASKEIDDAWNPNEFHGVE